MAVTTSFPHGRALPEAVVGSLHAALDAPCALLAPRTVEFVSFETVTGVDFGYRVAFRFSADPAAGARCETSPCVAQKIEITRSHVTS